MQLEFKFCTKLQTAFIYENHKYKVYRIRLLSTKAHFTMAVV